MRTNGKFLNNCHQRWQLVGLGQPVLLWQPGHLPEALRGAAPLPEAGQNSRSKRQEQCFRGFREPSPNTLSHKCRSLRSCLSEVGSQGGLRVVARPGEEPPSEATAEEKVLLLSPEGKKALHHESPGRGAGPKFLTEEQMERHGERGFSRSYINILKYKRTKAC